LPPEKHAIAARQMRGFGGMLAIELGSLEAARKMMEAGAAIVRAGAAGIFIDNCGLAHGGQHWLAMTEDASPDAVSFAFVSIIRGDTEVWTMGMHVLGLRDVARIEPGQKVLVNGASGGVGTFAVQIARALGARADAVCSLPNADLARSIGADDVIDYTSQDFTRSGRRYDVLLDIAGSRPVFACRRVLAPRGTLVLIGGPAGRWLQPAGHMFSALAMAPLVSQRIAMADTVSCTAKKQILMALTTLIEDGKVTPVISRRYPLHDLQEAVRYQEQGHAAGKVVVTI
jgi:NADPH:quinone reductase-like Zn-dependent oxidoreductase